MDFKKLIANLVAARAFRKGVKTVIKLGGEGIHYHTISDGESMWYELEVDLLDYQSNNVYKKTHNTYQLPVGMEPLGGISPRMATELYRDYLVDRKVEFVDGNNRVVEWTEILDAPPNIK